MRICIRKITLAEFGIKRGLEYEAQFKEGLQSVLRIGSAHNKGGLSNINIVQISHFLNSF